MTFVLQAGQRHESLAFEALMERGAVKRSRGGRPRLRPKRVVGDKAYSNRRIRCSLRQKGIRVTIPPKSDERRRGRFDKQLYNVAGAHRTSDQSAQAVPANCHAL